MRCALVNENGDVTNIIVADHNTDPAPAGFFLVPIKESSRVDTAWTYDASNKVFVCTLIEPADYQ